MDELKMRMKFINILIIISLIQPTFCFAKNKDQNGTIPFLVYEPYYQNPTNNSYNNTTATVNMLTNTNSPSETNKQTYKMFKQVNVPKYEIKNTISSLQKTICKTIQNGSVKIWLSTNIEGKKLFVNAAANSGIEITFNCSK